MSIDSPMMKQWQQCKVAAGDALLFFRLGDFYEAFENDALVIAKELELTLTQRQGTPMCGVPWHTSDAYIDRLVSKGFRVAVAEQVEEASATKGLVKREVVRVITPGTVVNSNLISEKNNNFIASIFQLSSFYGLAYLDLSTGEFRVTELEGEKDLINELYRLQPAECVISQKFQDKHPLVFKELAIVLQPLITVIDEWCFDHQSCYQFLVEHFQVMHLDGFGLKAMIASINAAGALLTYLKEQLCLNIAHVRTIRPYATSDALAMDKSCQRNLELTESLQDTSKKNTLLEILDHTSTPMGARQLRQWLLQPLMNTQMIEKRQDGIAALLSKVTIAEELLSLFPKVRDLERLMMKISSGICNPRELQALALSLEQIPLIKERLKQCDSALLANLENSLQALQDVVTLLKGALVEEPPIRVSEGNIFRSGYNNELDDLRNIAQNGKKWMADYQQRIKEETGIKTLKVSFNKIFGYYIEVSKGQAERMPESFQRRQTLVNSERFISPELKQFEDKVLHAEERQISLETDLFHDLRKNIITYYEQIMSNAAAIATVDCLLSLAHVARLHHYHRPLVDNSSVLYIKEGRHPIIEKVISQEKFVTNDTLLDSDHQRLMLITGPNMAGKSTYIRQIALIVIMAQIGSYVPAAYAHIGIIDKIFARIGANDDLSRGQSTFMMEMTETANILNNATNRSLVILDEIGRGTSTYDGISIAWSVVEYLMLAEGKMAKTLFATHYWELTKLEELIPGVVNYTVEVCEQGDQILFLHRIIKGTSDRSYGIHVGLLAGLPLPVIMRAREILSQLEKNEYGKDKPKKIKSPKETQLVLF